MTRVSIAALILVGLLVVSCAAEDQPSWSSIFGVSKITDIHAFLDTCTSDEELRILQSDFPILYEPAMRFRDPAYSCIGPTSTIRAISDQLAITQALRVIRQMRLLRPLPWTGLHPYEWLKSRIGAITVSYTANFNYCCHTVFPPGKPDGVQAITVKKASDDLLQSRLMWRDPSSGTGLGNLILLIFHEARHIDLSPDCRGVYDSSLEYMGAWGVQITLAHYFTEGWIEIGLPEDELPFLEGVVNDLESSRLCDQNG